MTAAAHAHPYVRVFFVARNWPCPRRLLTILSKTLAEFWPETGALAACPSNL